MLTSITMRPLIITLLFSISLNCLFGYLSYSFYSDKAVAEQALETCKGTNQTLSNSLDKQEKACKVGDGIASEFKRQEQALESQSEAVLQSIDTLPKQQIEKQSLNKTDRSQSETVINETYRNAPTEIDIDSKLPASLVGMLKEHCSRVKGSACTNP